MVQRILVRFQVVEFVGNLPFCIEFLLSKTPKVRQRPIDLVAVDFGPTRPADHLVAKEFVGRVAVVVGHRLVDISLLAVEHILVEPNRTLERVNLAVESTASLSEAVDFGFQLLNLVLRCLGKRIQFLLQGRAVFLE